MRYEPNKILEESFREHMKIPDTEDGNRCLHHNLEYFKWYVSKKQGEEGKVIFDKFNTYSPLGCCYGKDAKVDLIKEDLSGYVTASYYYLLNKILEAVYDLKKFKIPHCEIQLPKNWCSLIGPHILGIKIVENPIPRILSENKYGRFVIIHGID